MSEQDAVLERFRLHELIGRYVDALNHRDWDRYAKCWTEDCVFEMSVADSDDEISDKMTTTQRPIGVRTTGRDGVLGLVANYNRYPWLLQIRSGLVFELDTPDTARLRHTLQVNGSSIYLIGTCYDRAVRVGDGIWRLAHRDYPPS